MLLSNLESVPGHTISQQLDVVYGSTVRSKHADGVVSFVDQNTLVINAYPSRLCQAT